MTHLSFDDHFVGSTPSSYTRRKITPFGMTTSASIHISANNLELLAEEEELGLVVDGQDTGTGNTTEDVGTSTLEERLNSLLGDDLAGSIHGGGVLDGLTGGHHHAATDGVKGVRGNTGTGGDGPAEQEGGEERALKRTDEENGLDGIVHSEVETTVDDNSENGGTETTVETGETVGGEGLAVDIHESVELALTGTLGGLGVVGKTGTGVVQGVDEEEGSGTSGLGYLLAWSKRAEIFQRGTYTTGGKVTHHPLGVSITVLLEGEHGLVGVTEGKVKSLGGEVTDDVGSVSTPEGNDTLSGGGALEAVTDTVVLAVKTTGLEHLILLWLLETVADGCRMR